MGLTKHTKHTLFQTLTNLEGNVRGAVFTEPLWGIPFNLYAPYVSVYMLALGLTDSRIGLLTSIGMVFQVFWTLMGGVITDKLGRKRTTLIFDLISWSIPVLIWAVAQNFTYFLVAAVINAVWRVTHNSWSCLMVEDTDPDILVDVYSWIYIAGLLAAFAAPIAGLLIGRFGLVSTMRGLYLLAFVMMTAKALTMNALVTETQQGRVRMAETRGQSLFDVLSGFPAVFKQIIRSPTTLYTLGLMVILNIAWTIRGTFWSIVASRELLIPDANLALYPFARSITTLLFFFFGMPRIQRLAALRQWDERALMVFGFLGLIASKVLLLVTPVGSYGLLLGVTVLEGCSIPLTSTLLEKLTVVTVDAQERARIMALLNVMVLVLASPFGWIAGQLSTVNRRLPFVLSVGLFAVGGVLVYISRGAVRREAESRQVSDPTLIDSPLADAAS
jgi:MFS family permease